MGPTALRFKRAAYQRFESVQILTKAGLNYDAAYISGYVAECVMKAVILSPMTENQARRYEIEVFRGAVGHDFEKLKAVLSKNGTPIPVSLIKSFRRLNWSTSLRYSPGRVSRSDAAANEESARQFIEWGERTW